MSKGKSASKKLKVRSKVGGAKVPKTSARSVILASASPWRRRLLTRNGIRCRVYVSEFKELTKHKNPRFLALYNARGKAREALQHFESGIIVGVDTVGTIGGKILGKPKNRGEARAMLLLLRGRPHRVISGLCVIDAASGREQCTVETTRITFRKFTMAELERYLDCGQWKGKAGSYAIQGRAKGFVQKIEGEVANVVGVPLARLKAFLVGRLGGVDVK